mgnify:CR=1 FL=1
MFYHYNMTSRNYLSLPETLSQIYLNYYTVLAAILIVKIVLFRNSVINQLQNLSNFNLCDGHNSSEEFSNFVNRILAKNLDQLKSTNYYFILILLVVIKNLILFYIELFLGTYTCLLNAVISGTANFAIDTSEQVLIGVNQTIILVTSDIELGLNGLSSIINQLISGVSAIKNFFTGSGSNDGSEYTEKINLSIDALKHISIPGSVLVDIEKFRNDTLPDFTNLENSTQSLISKPFQILSKNLNNSMFNTKLISNDSFPVLKVTNPFCQNQPDFQEIFNDFAKPVETAAKIIIIILVIFAAISTVIVIVQQWNKRRHENRLVYVLNGTPSLRSRISVNNILNLYDNKLIYYLHKLKIIRTNNGLWLFSYVSTPASRMVLLIGVSGLLMVLLQYIILLKLQGVTKVISKSFAENDEFPQAIQKATLDYVNQTNNMIQSQCDGLNVELFGNIKQVSLSINSTLNTFWTDLNSTINTIFSHTPFQKPIDTVVYCTIGRKILKFEQGLTWINNHLSVSFPSVNETDFQNVDKFLTNNQSPVASYIEKGANGIIDIQKKALKLELIVSLIFIGLWVLQILIAVAILFVKLSIKQKQSEKILTSELTTTPNMISLDDISSPLPLTNEQRRIYGYALSNPQEVMEKRSKNSTR